MLWGLFHACPLWVLTLIWVPRRLPDVLPDVCQHARFLPDVCPMFAPCWLVVIEFPVFKKLQPDKQIWGLLGLSKPTSTDDKVKGQILVIHKLMIQRFLEPGSLANRKLWQSKCSFWIHVRKPQKRQRFKEVTANTHVQMTQPNLKPTTKFARVEAWTKANRASERE